MVLLIFLTQRLLVILLISLMGVSFLAFGLSMYMSQAIKGTFVVTANPFEYPPLLSTICGYLLTVVIVLTNRLISAVYSILHFSRTKGETEASIAKLQKVIDRAAVRQTVTAKVAE